MVAEEYPDACEDALTETGLPVGALPGACPYSVEAMLDKAFWPGP